MKSFPHAVLAIGLALLSCAAPADEGGASSDEESDWLIARRAGRWELVARGVEGRVRKDYPNQEVLRLVNAGAYVEVMSMPPVVADEAVTCSQRARRDARDPCSSNFLLCRPDPALAVVTLATWLVGGAGTAAETRNQLACRPDVDAILEAAKDVGMIRRILPRPDPVQ